MYRRAQTRSSKVIFHPLLALDRRTTATFVSMKEDITVNSSIGRNWGRRGSPASDAEQIHHGPWITSIFSSRESSAARSRARRDDCALFKDFACMIAHSASSCWPLDRQGGGSNRRQGQTTHLDGEGRICGARWLDAQHNAVVRLEERCERRIMK